MADDGQDGMPAVDSSKDQQQQSKALDSLTDHVEERQLDSSRVQQAMASISARAESDRNAQRLKELELSKVKINQADVDIMVEELEERDIISSFPRGLEELLSRLVRYDRVNSVDVMLDRKVAEKRLREHMGDPVAAIRSFLDS